MTQTLTDQLKGKIKTITNFNSLSGLFFVYSTAIFFWKKSLNFFVVSILSIMWNTVCLSSSSLCALASWREKINRAKMQRFFLLSQPVFNFIRMNLACRLFSKATIVTDSAILNYRYAYNDKGLMISRYSSGNIS